MRRIRELIVVCALMAALGTAAAWGADTAVVNTLSAEPDVESAAQCVLVVDRDSGQALYERNTWDRVYPASTTKLMTALVAAEAVKDLDRTKVTVRQEVLDQLPDDDNSLAGLLPGEELTMRQLLYALMLPSGNDAALVIADHVGGSESAFVEQMNRRAAELGCTDTVFVNSHGLAWMEQYSSAWDLARIAEAYMRVPELAEIAGTHEIAFSTNLRKEVRFTNSNLLLDPESELYMPEVSGAKTGITSLGASFISVAERDGLRVLCVASEVPAQDAYGNLISPNPALAEGRKYLEWALGTFERVTLCEGGEEMAVPIEGTEQTVTAGPEQTVTAVVPREAAAELTRVITPAAGLTGRPAGGEAAGHVSWYSGQTLVAGDIPLYVPSGLAGTPGGLAGVPAWVWIALAALLTGAALLAIAARQRRRKMRRAAVPVRAERGPDADVWADRPEWMREVLLDEEDWQ